MIPPQDAVANAKKYIRDLEPDESLTDLRLEEVKLDSKKKEWLITLGYFRKRSFDLTCIRVNVHSPLGARASRPHPGAAAILAEERARRPRSQGAERLRIR